MPKTSDVERLRSIKTLPQLIAYLRDELDWPLSADSVDDVTFDYSAEELGITGDAAVQLKEIKRLRPLHPKQPWGIFWVNFEKKRLPVVVLRRILQRLVIKKRASANKADQRAWDLHDLLFISSYGESAERAITFAHFSEHPDSGDLPTLRVLGWDDQDTVLHLDHAHVTLLQKMCWPKNEEDLESWRATWSSAFTLRNREVITSSKELASGLAILATRIRKRANSVLAIESERGPFRKLHEAFKESLIRDLSEDDFADMYAQTIAYGLLTARFSRSDALIAEHLVDLIPATNPFLKDLLGTFLTLGGRKGKVDFDELGINEVVDLLRSTDADAIKRDFGNLNPDEDPVIRFYEDFLKQYDAKKRLQRGVFFTPVPVVSFIVRSVHEVLQREFGLEDGLADTSTWGEMAKRHKGLKIPNGISPDEPFVQILDFAAGTGTFMVMAIEVIYRTLTEKWTKQGRMELEFYQLWDEYVPKHLLPRLYGFELMMAPYAIAHMKIGLKLSETGYRFHSDERLRLYLTNTLEQPQDVSGQLEFMAPALAHEAKAVNRVKRAKRFTVIIGNPPYSGHSTNKGEWISRQIQAYKMVDGKPLDEKNLKWLQDDYVKFIRVAQTNSEEATEGVTGLITNHSWIDNPTFRGMRRSLMGCFDQITILDLHGNYLKREKTPTGHADENVFDIQQGVAIAILVKHMIHSRSTIDHSDLWGSRQSKYVALDESSHSTLESVRPKPTAPFFFFVTRDESLSVEFNSFAELSQFCPTTSVGGFTARDHLTIHFTKRGVWETVKDFVGLSAETARRKYELGDDVRDWRVKTAQNDLRLSGPTKENVVPILYRPFDIRYTYYTGRSRGFHCMPRGEVMRNMLKQNLALCIGRAGNVVGSEFDWNLAYCSPTIIDLNLFYRGGSQNYPLYIYEDVGSLGLSGHRTSNISSSFVAAFCTKMGIKTKSNPSETIEGLDLFGYIYGVFHSPSYRQRYEQFLRNDFPRVPLTSSIRLFRSLATLGGELIHLHLMDSSMLDRRITRFVGKESEVEKVTYTNNTVWIDKAQLNGFKGVPENVWQFRIGGFQVCEKWLKDRKGRVLSKEDTEHYRRIVVALNETIRIMAEIDKVIDEHGGWPLK